MLYPEHAFLDRFQAAAADGFLGVEYLFPYAFSASDIKEKLLASGLQQVLFNAPPGNWDAGERGIACHAGREAEFQRGIMQALDYAAALNCPRIHVMAGLVPTNMTPAQARANYVCSIRWAAVQAAKQSVDILLEPINTRDMPGYFLNYQQQAHDIVDSIFTDIGSANVKVQFDLYHCQIMEGDVASKLRHYMPTGQVGHIQIAGVPQRNEPDMGELNYPYLFDVIDELAASNHKATGSGWIGCEYRPAAGTQAGGTTAGLAWFKRYKNADSR